MHDIFFFTDIHGMYDLYRAIMDYCDEQDPEAMIIFGGDACDRGRQGYKIMKELLDNPRVVYLRGNHEEIFCNAAREIKEKFEIVDMERKEMRSILYTTLTFDNRFLAIQHSLNNGGMNTLLDWIDDGMPMDIIERLERLPFTFSTDMCDFCHAAGVYQTFERASEAEYEGEKVDSRDAEALVWCRSAFNIGWKSGRTAVFGHTPVISMNYYMPVPEGIVQPLKWVGKLFPDNNGPKINMDTGAVFTGIAYVLNVLTMQAQGFEDTDYTENEIRKHDVKKIDCVQM